MENPTPNPGKVFFYIFFPLVSSGPHEGPGRQHGGRGRQGRKACHPHGPSGMNTAFMLTGSPCSPEFCVIGIASGPGTLSKPPTWVTYFVYMMHRKKLGLAKVASKVTIHGQYENLPSPRILLLLKIRKHRPREGYLLSASSSKRCGYGWNFFWKL